MTGGSLLAGQIGWQRRPTLLCSGRHRFNKEKFVQNLFIWKSRVWQQDGWRRNTRTHALHPPTTPATLMPILSLPPSPSRAQHWCIVRSFVFFFLPLTSKRRCKGHQFHLQFSKERYSVFFCTRDFFIMHLDFQSTGRRYVIVLFLRVERKSYKLHELNNSYYSSWASMSRPFSHVCSHAKSQEWNVKVLLL